MAHMCEATFKEDLLLLSWPFESMKVMKLFEPIKIL